MGLERIETKRGHKYLLDGQPVKGVTTLLGSGMPKPALMYWSAKMVAEYVADNHRHLDKLLSKGRDETIQFLKTVPWAERDKAAARGTDIHKIAETIIHGGEAEVPSEIADYVHGYIKWLDEYDVEPILTEKVVANREYNYAGTFDAILKFNAGPLQGKTYLCDWKTSSSVYGEMAMQLSAYYMADFYVDDDGSEKLLPAIDGLAIVHITKEKTSVWIVTDSNVAWDSFLLVMDLANSLDEIERLMEPIDSWGHDG